MTQEREQVRWLRDVGSADADQVGGKNASLGEMVRALEDRGIRVPDGFATTADAYRSFLAHNDLEARIAEDVHSVRQLILDAELPPSLEEAIRHAYRELSARQEVESADVAVRSSATAEDLPGASFAGQQESFLNVTGEEAVLASVKRCYASLFGERAIVYREEKGFDHLDVALSVGVQEMVRSDRGGAGVLFTIDTESGFPDVVVITAAWGLGEYVVQGTVDPDQYSVFKPLLDQGGFVPIVDKRAGDKSRKLVYAQDGDAGGEATTGDVEVPEQERRAFVLGDDEVLQLARWGCLIEGHYGKPMDVEWAKDGDGSLYVVQARPETVHSQRATNTLTTYRLTDHGNRLVTGLAVGDSIAAGAAYPISGPEAFDRFEDGGVIAPK